MPRLGAIAKDSKTTRMTSRRCKRRGFRNQDKEDTVSRFRLEEDGDHGRQSTHGSWVNDEEHRHLLGD